MKIVPKPFFVQKQIICSNLMQDKVAKKRKEINLIFLWNFNKK